jgi:EAL domain-containing protein (putative c-di-GMP-specific phosphodiesterase class I)
MKLEGLKLRVLKGFLFYGLVFVVLFLVWEIIHVNYENNKEEELELQLSQLTTVNQGLISHLFEDVNNDLKIIESSSEFNNYLENDTSDNKTNLESLFTHVMDLNTHYSQLRYITMDGMEQVRINRIDGELEIVEDEGLQYKGDRYYFIETIGLNEGRLYISELDFNIENGVIVEPYEPVIRLATPVYNEGIQEGIIIVNYSGQEFIHYLTLNAGTLNFEVEVGLVDNNTYWYENTEDGIIKYSQDDNPIFGLPADDQNFSVINGTHYILQNLVFDPSFDYNTNYLNGIKLSVGVTHETLEEEMHNLFFSSHGFATLIISLLSLVVVGVVFTILSKMQEARSTQILDFVSSFNSDGIVVLNENNHAIFVNDMFTEIFGYKVEDLNDDRLSNIVSMNCRILVDEGGFQTGYVWNVRKTGEYILSPVIIKSIGLVVGSKKHQVGLYQSPHKISIVDFIPNSESTKMEHLICTFVSKNLTELYKTDKKQNDLLLFVNLQNTGKLSLKELTSINNVIVNEFSKAFETKKIYLVNGEVSILLIDASKNNMEEMYQYLTDKIEYTMKQFDIKMNVVNSPLVGDFYKLVYDNLINLEIGRLQSKILLYYSKDDQRTIENYLYLTRILSNTLTNDMFYVVYQSQRDIKTRQIKGIEVLVRLQNEDGKNVSPAEFIPVIEERKLIRDLTSIVVENTIKELEQSKFVGDDIKVSINLSGEDFNEEHILNDIIKPIQESSLNPKIFCFEITETVLLKNTILSREMIDLFHEHGHRIILDDFGTGYSSLAYLKQFQFDYIKIDKVFIQTAGENSNLLKAIIALGNELGINIIVEGVETEEQYNIIKGYNIDSYQGFLDSYPTKIEDINKELNKK